VKVLQLIQTRLFAFSFSPEKMLLYLLVARY
jgi:hypothetical protein